MLLAVLCNLNNSASHHFRNAHGVWKTKSKLNLPYDRHLSKQNYVILTSNRVFPREQYVIFHDLSFSLKYLYYFLKQHCSSYIQSHVVVQKRSISDINNARWKKYVKTVVTLFPKKVVKKLKLHLSKKHTKLDYVQSDSYSNQHVLEFPYYFSKTYAGNPIPFVMNPSSSNPITSDKDRLSKIFINLMKKSSPDSAFEENLSDNNVSNEQSNKNNLPDKEVIESNDNFNNEKYKLHNRSQYEHLATRLSSEKKDLIEDKSIFNTFKSILEVPMNSFFSFISRTSKIELQGSAKTEQKLVSDKSQPEKPSTDNKVVSPPKSVLEGLYQYVPYIKQNNANTNIDESTQLHKETERLKAEKELLHQKININNRTRYLLQAINESASLFNLIRLVEELKDHLLRFPDTRIAAVKENGIQDLMHVYCTANDEDLIRSSRMILAMLGAVDPPKMKGIRLLSFDGGGSRGISALEICRRLVELTGQPINELFDYICGVSTGAILGFALGVLKMPVDELAPLYRELSTDIFSRSKLVGTGNLVISHAYYNTEAFQKLLKKIFGSQLLIETAALEDVPKCSAVSTLVNCLPLKPFLWRNYSIVPGTRHTHWNGSSRSTMWEAIRASSAAPGYFEEYKKGYNIHQDGGVLTNNPTGVALNECRLLWPHAPIQCVVSIGTGRYEPVVGPMGEEFSSLKDKFLKLVDSATNVTEVHKVMYDLLPASSYFRFNPFLDEPLLLDECRPEKIDLLIQNTRDYIQTNDYKFRACAKSLTNKKAF